MNVEIADTTLSRLRGLLGRKEYPDLLLITDCNDIHTFGMRHAIDVAFISADGVVLKSFRALGSCRRVYCKNASSTLERIASHTPWYVQGDCVSLYQLLEKRR